MKSPKPLTALDDLYVGAPLQAKSDGTRYTVGLGLWEFDKDDSGHLRYPIKNAAGEVVARLRLAAIRRRFIRPVS